MKSTHSIPFWMLIVMNINVIIGAGLFVNPAPITRLGGVLGVLSYLAVALLVLPIVLTVASISQIYPATEGGLNVYIRSGLGRFWGILGIGSYFFAKVISTTLLMKTSLFYLQGIFPSLMIIQPSFFLIFLLMFLLFLNMGGVQFGSTLQFIFMILKIFPIVLVVLCMFLVFDTSSFQTGTWTFEGFASSLPIALYGLMGFEMCCSIGHIARGGSRKLAFVVVASFFIVVSIATLFQLALFSGLGMRLASLPAPMSDYFSLVSRSFPAGLFVNISIFCSVLGASYGFLYSNNWNLYAIIRELGLWDRLLKKNKCGTPVLVLIIHCIIIGVLLLFDFKIVTFVRLAVLGVTTCYTLVALSLIRSYKEHRNSILVPKVVPILSLFTCLYIVVTCFKDLF
jgi:amino acid transporter